MEVATPYARGSTRSADYRYKGTQGYPVCTGIDRNSNSISRFNFRLPRMHGDRPPTLTCKTISRWGYPVCTGIDRRLRM